jgi:hypothetical protein
MRAMTFGAAVADGLARTLAELSCLAALGTNLVEVLHYAVLAIEVDCSLALIVGGGDEGETACRGVREEEHYLTQCDAEIAEVRKVTLKHNPPEARIGSAAVHEARRAFPFAGFLGPFHERFACKSHVDKHIHVLRVPRNQALQDISMVGLHHLLSCVEYRKIRDAVDVRDFWNKTFGLKLEDSS